jgi:hypothetical protein
MGVADGSHAPHVRRPFRFVRDALWRQLEAVDDLRPPDRLTVSRLGTGKIEERFPARRPVD